MPHGANYVHKQLRTELEDYIKSQYFGKSPILLSALSNILMMKDTVSETVYRIVPGICNRTKRN